MMKSLSLFLESPRARMIRTYVHRKRQAILACLLNHHQPTSIFSVAKNRLKEDIIGTIIHGGQVMYHSSYFAPRGPNLRNFRPTQVASSASLPKPTIQYVCEQGLRARRRHKIGGNFHLVLLCSLFWQTSKPTHCALSPAALATDFIPAILQCYRQHKLSSTYLTTQIALRKGFCYPKELTTSLPK